MTNKSHYRIHFYGNPSKVVYASNYDIKDGFCTFFIYMPGCDKINISTFPAASIAKIEVYTENNDREEKLKRLLKKHSLLKRIWRKFFN